MLQSVSTRWKNITRNFDSFLAVDIVPRVVGRDLLWMDIFLPSFHTCNKWKCASHLQCYPMHQKMLLDQRRHKHASSMSPSRRERFYLSMTSKWTCGITASKAMESQQGIKNIIVCAFRFIEFDKGIFSHDLHVDKAALFSCFCQ